MKKRKYGHKGFKNYPIAECAKAIVKILRTYPEGTAVYQKWTCGGCGERVTGSTPNMLAEQGCHDEREDGSPCGFVTDIRKTGCNYSVHTAVGGIASMPGKGNA